MTTTDPTPFDETPLDPNLLHPSTVDDTSVDPTPGGPEEPFAGEVPLTEAAPEPAATTKARPSAAELAAARRESDLKAIYAFAGFTELAVGAVRSTVTDTSRWANARLAELRLRREELAKQTEEVRRIAEGLPEDVKAAPEVARGRVNELQEQATNTYSDLASRGQRVLNGVRSDVTRRIDPAFDKIQERIDAARRAIKTRAVSTTVPPAPATPAPGPVDAVLVEEVVVPEGADVTFEPTSEADRRL